MGLMHAVAQLEKTAQEYANKVYELEKDNKRLREALLEAKTSFMVLEELDFKGEDWLRKYARLRAIDCAKARQEDK